jgi:hypothetical protein
MTTSRSGTGLVETLVALLLTFGLLAVVGTVLVREQRAAASLVERVEWLEAARVGRDLVGLAVAGDAMPDAESADLPGRSFTGHGTRCGEEGWLLVGRRQPDPARDSLWVVSGDGRVRVVDLRAVGGATCVDPVAAVRLETEPPLPRDARVVRVFERGLWRVDDAVRYRRGGGGAQPLTAPVLDPRRSDLRVEAGGIVLEVAPREGGTAVGLRWRRP